MKLKVYLTGIIFIYSLNLFSQENEVEAFKKTFHSELKVVESKLAKRPKDPNLQYKYGLLSYKLCRYREAQKLFYKCMETYKNNAYFFLDLYHVELALKNKQSAQEYYYNYLVLSNKLTSNNDSHYSYQEIYTKESPSIVNTDPNSLDYFPFVLNNGRVKFLTLKDYTYTEPTSPLLFRNYLTNIVVFSDNEFRKLNKVKQPNKDSEGFSYGTFCLNKNQDKIFMTRYDGRHHRMIICLSEKNGRSWGPFRTLTYFAKKTKYNFIHPMLTENEDKLVFASNMSGGRGGYDLWIADITVGNDLKNISNLGSSINTLGNECFPTLYNQEEIFFSSDGHPGYGSLDLYRVNIKDTNQTQPINLGSGINSTRDDYGLFYSKDLKTAFFTSNRSFSYANLFMDKIYKIKANVFDCELINYEIRKSTEGLIVTNNSLQSTQSLREHENQELVNANNLSNMPSHASQLKKRESNRKIEQPLEHNKQSDNIEHKNPPNSISELNPTVKKSEGESSTMIYNHSKPVHKIQREDQVSKSRVETAKLTQDNNEAIEKKIVHHSDEASNQNAKTDGIIENKFWTMARLWFSDFNIPISLTYIKVVNPKNEVVFSDYSNQDGIISIEVTEGNEYTVEIPRFQTMKKGVVFNSRETNLYFPYGNQPKNSTSSSISVIRNETKNPIRKSNNTEKEKRKISNSKLAIAKPYFFRPRPNHSKQNTTHPKSGSSIKNELDKKNAPRNMIENFN